MYKIILRSLDDVSIFPVISIIIFFGFFMALLIWVARMDKQKIKTLSAMPMEGEGELSINNGELGMNNGQ